jgi:Zn-dependent protease
MIFRGGGDVFDPAQIDAIIKSKHWVLILFVILSQMNLITFIFNIIPLPPLDGWKILSYGIQKGTKKEINEKVELIMTVIVLVLFIYIFVSGIICDFIR